MVETRTGFVLNTNLKRCRYINLLGHLNATFGQVYRSGLEYRDKVRPSSAAGSTHVFFSEMAPCSCASSGLTESAMAINSQFYICIIIHHSHDSLNMLEKEK
jgi:hypothetical protein